MIPPISVIVKGYFLINRMNDSNLNTFLIFRCYHFQQKEGKTEMYSIMSKQRHLLYILLGVGILTISVGLILLLLQP